MLNCIRRSRADKDQGFTMIEALVVCIIIGVLGVIAIPALLSQRKKGVDASLKSDMREMATAQESYMAVNPGDMDGVSVTIDERGIGGVPGLPPFRASAGNIIWVWSMNPVPAEGPGYCIKGTNAQSSLGRASALWDDFSQAEGFYYNSATGGMTTTPCMT